MAHGLMVFRSLQAAILAGYQVYDRTATGYLVRTRIANAWALAVVELRSPLGGALE